MNPFHTNVSLRGFHFEDAILTVNLAEGIEHGTHEGRAVTIDTTGPNKMKLAGDGDYVVGRLETIENREVEGQLVGAVAFQFGNRIPIADGATINPGDTVVGAGDGFVRASEEPDYNANFVGEVEGAFAVVVKI